MKKITVFLSFILVAGLLLFIGCQQDQNVENDGMIDVVLDGVTYKIPEMAENPEAYAIIEKQLPGTLTEDQQFDITVQLKNVPTIEDELEHSRANGSTITVATSHSASYYFYQYKKNYGWIGGFYGPGTWTNGFGPHPDGYYRVHGILNSTNNLCCYSSSNCSIMYGKGKFQYQYAPPSGAELWLRYLSDCNPYVDNWFWLANPSTSNRYNFLTNPCDQFGSPGCCQGDEIQWGGLCY